MEIEFTKQKESTDQSFGSSPSLHPLIPKIKKSVLISKADLQLVLMCHPGWGFCCLNKLPHQIIVEAEIL